MARVRKSLLVASRAVFGLWALVGAVAAVFLLWSQAIAVGGPAGLLQVGEASPLRPVIEAELGDIPLADGHGHDGQIYYAIGLDLDGDEVAPLLDHGAYRYRRILFPLMSSAFGLLDGQALLWGLIVVAGVSMAVATGAVAATALDLNLPPWIALSVLLNPGVWLSVRLLTADVVAIALMTVALCLMVKRKRSPVVGFSLSVLAKDVYLTSPLGLALSRDRRSWMLGLVPALVLVAWMTWLTFAMGEGFTGRGNLSLPLAGIWSAMDNWDSFDLEEWVYVGFALASMALGFAFAASRRSWLRWSILGWSILAAISSSWVWDFGNNAARAFAPIVILVALGIGQRDVTGSD